MPLTEMQDRIIKTMAAMDRAVTVKMIADEMGVVTQTVRNHLPKLLNMGRVEISRRMTYGNAVAYVLTEGGSGNHNPITWKSGEMIPMRAIFEEFAKTPLSDNPYWGNIERVILKLYQISMSAVDEDNPQPASALELRELRRALENIRENASLVRNAVEDMLSYEELWIPRELPKALIISDTKLDLDRARDIVDRLD